MEDDTVYDAGDRDQVEENKKLFKLAQRQYDEDLKNLVSTPQGLRFFKNMFERGRIEHDCYTGDRGTDFNLGVRKMVIDYWKDIKRVSPDQFIKIIMSLEDTK
jgi:hypothetical protein